MLTSRLRGSWCDLAPIAALKADNMLLSGRGTTAAAFVCRESNERGPSKGPLPAAPRTRGAAPGRIFERFSIQEHTS